MILIIFAMIVVSVVLPLITQQGILVDDYIKNVMNLPKTTPVQSAPTPRSSSPVKASSDNNNYDTLQTNFNFDEDAQPKDFM